LYAHGATVIMACRSLERGNKAKAEIEDAIERGDPDVCVATPAKHKRTRGKLLVRELDVSDLESVAAFAKAFQGEFGQLDVLVNNAGINGIGNDGPRRTKQGVEKVFGTNFVGHYLLTRLLQPQLAKSTNARVVNLASVMHHWSSSSVSGAARGEDESNGYDHSKMAMILFAAELQRRHGAATFNAVSVNPGFVDSDIWRGFDALPLVGKAFRFATALLALTPAQGAVTTVAAAMGTWRGRVAGKLSEVTYLVPYYLPKGFWLPFEMMGPFAGARSVLPRLPRDEPAESRALWDACEKLCAGYL